MNEEIDTTAVSPTPHHERRDDEAVRWAMPVNGVCQDGPIVMFTEELRPDGMTVCVPEFVPPELILGVRCELRGNPRPLTLPVQARGVGRTTHGFGIELQFRQRAGRDFEAWSEYYHWIRHSSSVDDEWSGGHPVGRRGLIVASERLMTSSLLLELREACWQVRCVADSEALLTLCEQRRPNIVLCELGGDTDQGMALCRRIVALRSERGEVTPRIILVADRSSSGAFLRGLQAGADFVIARPFAPDYFLSRVHHLLSAKESQPARPSTATPSSRSTPMYKRSSRDSGIEVRRLEMPDAPLLDRAVERASDFYFLAKLYAREQLRRLRGRDDDGSDDE